MIKKDKRAWSVLEDTIGQCTNLKDKNGVEIYEGDILEIDEEGRKLFGTEDRLFDKYQVVVSDDGCYMATPSKHYGELCKTEHKFVKSTYLWVIQQYATVVGNIHDNPELLESED